MQELARQNQELMALLRSRGEIPSPGQGQNGEEIPRNETGRNQSQNHNQNDEGSSANQNREPHPQPHPSQVADPAKSAADARAAKLEEELKEMREQMKEMKSQVKAKAAKNLDMLIHRSESPFTKRIDEYPLPAKFKVPQLETFDRFKDPLDYLDSFRTIMRLHGVSDEIMCRTFPTNLRGSAMTWFNQLETGSIDTFAQLSRAFIDNFIGGRRSVRPANYLLNIRQREGESLRSYVQRFNKEALQIDEPNEYIALTAFNAGLLKGDFLFQLCKDPPKSMSELMYEAQKFINAEDAFQARDEFLSRKRKEPEDRRFDSSRNKSSRQDYSKDERKHLEDLKETFETLRRYRMKLNPNKCVFGVLSGKFLGFMVSQRGIEANPDKIKAVLEMTPPRTTKEVQSLTGRVAALNRFVSRATDKCLPFFKTLRKAFVWTDECQKSFEELKRYLTSPPLLSPSQQGEALSLYLAVSPTAVSSALIREDGGTQLPVYYTSKAFQGAEERYPAMEKLALALVIAARKLRPYFQSHKIIVLTNHPLRKAMNKPDAAGRLIQWAVELSEFNIEYHPRQAIKAQALADFIAEFTVTEDEPSKQKPDEEWEVEIDGSSVKGAGGVGIVFKTPEGHLLKHSTRLQYPTTNNEAEYEALLTSLRIAKELGANRLKIRSDSQLIVGQVNGEYEAREDRMTKYLKLVQNAMKWFDEVMLVQVPREQNTEADALAKLASSDEATDQYIEVQHSPSHLEEKISPINVSNSWMTPIVNYLEDETLPSDPVEARKLKARSTRFTVIQGVLYKRGFSLPYLRCLDEAEADYVMREVHERICGNHSGARSLVHKIVRAGYYWPTMQKDAVSYVRACDKCQRFGNLIHSPPETLTPMTAPWPFAQWGLDIMGPLPVGRRQLKFLVVGIDYFTKWVEAEPLATITERNIRDFVWKVIICRFGIPRAFISDNGRQFDNSPFREFCEELGIHNHYSSPGHPQANGQVEVTNRSLLKMIKTRLEGAKGLWPEELPNILWAYRTMARTPTGETPFRLTYGTEAVIPVEIGLTTWRTNNYDEEINDDQLRSNLDLVDEVRDQVEARTRVYQQRMARYYDRRVKHREFKVGDLVLRKVTLATKDPAQGKLGPTWEGPYRVVKFHRRGTYHLEKLDGDALPHPWNAEHLKKYYQ
jgi:ribonuclease HI